MFKFFGLASLFSFTSVVLLLLATVSPSVAKSACQAGQMAVGQKLRVNVMYSPSTAGAATRYYSGFMMQPDCKIISQNGETQSDMQQCKGDWFKGASVECSGSEISTAYDTDGKKWNCHSTSDRGCNNMSSLGGFIVTGCCDPA